MGAKEENKDEHVCGVCLYVCVCARAREQKKDTTCVGGMNEEADLEMVLARHSTRAEAALRGIFELGPILARNSAVVRRHLAQTAKIDTAIWHTANEALVHELLLTLLVHLETVQALHAVQVLK